jgi:hypothetical protein
MRWEHIAASGEGDRPQSRPLILRSTVSVYVKLAESPNTTHTISTEMPNIMGWACAQQLIEIKTGHQGLSISSSRCGLDCQVGEKPTQ